MSPESGDLWVRAIRAIRTAGGWSEEDPDASSSRAYYAAFYAVSAFFALTGQTFAKHSALHAAVHRDLVNTGRWSPDLGADFRWLIKVRHTGDYGGSAHTTVAEAKDSVERARRILFAVRELDPREFAQMVPPPNE